MMIETKALIGAALDWAVARANGVPAIDIRFDAKRIYRWQRDEDGELTHWYMTGSELLFSTHWEAGGPIIEREGIAVGPFTMANGIAPAAYNNPMMACRAYPRGATTVDDDQYGPTPLIAAMRCFVASKLGVTVDVPKGATRHEHR